MTDRILFRIFESGYHLNPTRFHLNQRRRPPLSAEVMASKMIFLFTAHGGLGPSIFQPLQPSSSSNLTREVKTLNIHVAEKYGLGLEAESCELAEFIAPDGSVQVSIFLLPDYKPPIAICVVHELLILISKYKSSEPPVILLPYYIEPRKITWERIPESLELEGMLYGVEMGDATESTQAILSGVPRLPSTTRIHCEPLNCFVHLVKVFNLPAVLLVGTGPQHQKTNDADNELEALCELGHFLANFAGLSFTGKKISLKEHEVLELLGPQEPWRALYG